MSDPNVADFWKEVEHQKELKNQIKIAQAEGMLQSARATTDGVVNAIKTTNEIHQQNLLSLLPAGYSPTVGLKSGEQTTKLDSLFEYTPTTRLDSSSEYTPLDSSSEYIPSEGSDEEDESELIPVRRKKTKLKLNESPSSPSPQLPGQSIRLIPTDIKDNNIKEGSCKEIQETRSNNHIDQQQSSQHEVDTLGLSTNDEMDPETCEEVGENEMDLDLQKPFIVRITESNSEGLEWDDVMQKVEAYRKQLKKTKYAFDPLYYYLIDHSGFHSPTLKLLFDVFPQMLSALPKMCFCVPKLTEEEAKFIDELLKAKDVDDVPAMTEVEKTFRKLFSRILDSIIMIRKNDLPEVEHTFRNVVPLLDATIGKDSYFWVKYGEQSLGATAIRRNKERDPNERARIGFKVDAMIEYQNLSWIPVIGCLEVSGGLPQCSRSKEWDDTLKLGLELRDLWAIARNQLMGIDVSQLVWWGLTVVGRKIRVYAFSATGGLFHLVLMYEAFLPSSCEDLYNLELCYLVLKEYKKKLNETKNMLCELNRKKVQLITRKRNLEESIGSNLMKKPKIVNSPDQKRNKRS